MSAVKQPNEEPFYTSQLEVDVEQVSLYAEEYNAIAFILIIHIR